LDRGRPGGNYARRDCAVQINKKAGMDFATIMKAFLRCDPDVIMVGEMRDKETVSIGIEASLRVTWCLRRCTPTAHRNSITRLLDMGMDPFNFADAILGILAQRLTSACAKSARSRISQRRTKSSRC